MTRGSQTPPGTRRRLAWLLCVAALLAALLGGAWLLHDTQPNRGATPSRTPSWVTLVPTFTALPSATPVAALAVPEATQTGAQVTAPGGADPQAPTETATVEAPPVEFTWAISNTQHYSFHYAPGTAAERDLPQIGAVAEAAFRRTRQALGTEFDGQMKIYLVPRVFWQGAATYGDKVQLISYLDRNYTEIEMWSYFTHEGTHALAQDLIQPKQEGGPDGVLVEGLAVWATGGHYDVEPIDAWAAVTAASESYIPLTSLRAGPFYDFQHEISYLEAGSFVKYLAERYGLDKLKDLYGEATGQAEHDEALVSRLYGKGYESLEADWLAYLEMLSPTAEDSQTWSLVVRSFDLMRRYETAMDPDARILPNQSPTDWTSDTLRIFLHQEQAPANVVLETALIAAQIHLRNGDLDRASSLLDDVEASLEAGGQLARPSLEARLRILDLVESQDRAILEADVEAYEGTWAGLHSPSTTQAGHLLLRFSEYRQEVIRLDVAPDGQGAQGVVVVHAQVDGSDFEDGRLFGVTFVLQSGDWRMAGREPMEPSLSLPPP
ncbi:MAG TPA: hypothetical protein PKO09_13695 [Anaerolineae bacterium]|nr:hypothetical protein [Anaerolineae bacterium]